MDQVLKAIKGLASPVGRNNNDGYDRSQYQGTYNKQYRLHNYPYNT